VAQASPRAISSLTDGELRDLYGWDETDHVRLNMVFNSAGSAVGSDGTSATISSTQDRRLLRIIRSDVDVVISGAASIRAEGWHLPPQGTLVVVSSSGDIPWGSCPDRSRVRVLGWRAELNHFLRETPGRILCEGGLSLAGLISAGHGFDSIALTSLNSLPSLAPLGCDESEFVKVHELFDDKPVATFSLWRRAATHG
jgi:riboflavin biosynthesis pyrimidine reductase